MTKKEIVLPRKLVNELLHFAQLSQNEEVCGFVGKSAANAYSSYPVDNVADDPSKRFLMDAENQLSAMKDMREKEQEMFAIYHSHPTAPAVPSATDIKLATYPDAIYLIISLNTKGVLEIRGFTIVNASVEEIGLSLLSN